MKIQRRLGLSFLVILVLYGINVGVYYWGNQRRTETVETLRKALSRQTLFSSLKLQLTNQQQQVTLMTQIMSDIAAEGLDQLTISEFNTQLEQISREASELEALSDTGIASEVQAFKALVHKLSASWRIFYDNFGRRHSRAIMEVAVTSDPLAALVMEETLPHLYQEEQSRVQIALQNYLSVSKLADGITNVMFSFSLLATTVVAFTTSRYISKGLEKLKQGASELGRGLLKTQIDIQSNDELGSLASSFNEMGQNLLAAETSLLTLNENLAQNNTQIKEQKEKTESLLRNILPSQVADELKNKGRVEPKYFEDVTIMFTDFVGFTASTQKLAADELVGVLHDYFTAFDHIVARYNIEKLKTIGDSYMCVAGLPERNPSHPVDMILAAQEMIAAVQSRNHSENLAQWSIRIGIHTGAVVAGVVGIKKFSFDIWGDAVNEAKGLEAQGLPNRINISDRTHTRIKDFFDCEARGKVQLKGDQSINMFFVNDVLERLSEGEDLTKAPLFLERYRLYFQQDFPLKASGESRDFRTSL